MVIITVDTPAFVLWPQSRSSLAAEGRADCYWRLEIFFLRFDSSDSAGSVRHAWRRDRRLELERPWCELEVAAALRQGGFDVAD
jgi:hypothetical protein